MKSNLDIPEKGTKNLFIYFSFLLIVLIGIFYGNSIKNEFELLRIWDTSNILLLLLGVPFLFLFERLQIPNFWENKIAIKHKLYLPISNININIIAITFTLILNLIIIIITTTIIYAG